MTRLNAGIICIKYIIFGSNFVFVILGLILLTLGLLFLTIFNCFELFLESQHFKPTQLLTAVGAIIFLISFVGLLGAIKESTLLINLYGILSFLLLLGELIFGFTSFAMHCDIFDNVKDNMMDALRNYEKTHDAQEAWDFTQDKMHCCGVDEPYDWKRADLREGQFVSINGTWITVPYSCCENKAYCDKVYGEGCLKVFQSYISNSSAAMGYLLLGISFIQLLGVFISCIMTRAIRRAKTEQEMERQQRFADRRDPVALSFPNPTSTDA